MKLINKIGIFNPDGEIILHPGISVSWKSLSYKNIPDLPQGTPLNLDISLDEKVLISGNHGIVWATYDQRQAEVIFNALLAQNIASAIGKVELENNVLLLIKIQNIIDISDAMNFIWRKEGGLKLKPDWTYPEGEVNKSFEQWVNG
ncbi:MAG: hypothetical protein CVT92_11095 [Bacteroidetes bacterium HGW-Bacteroidetes-1]|nr:MAG: hypothetical protein CVT92_11095 [Bacteroidetes bacterium HGW-Bacteroidetes-1]